MPQCEIAVRSLMCKRTLRVKALNVLQIEKDDFPVNWELRENPVLTS